MAAANVVAHVLVWSESYPAGPNSSDAFISSRTVEVVRREILPLFCLKRACCAAHRRLVIVYRGLSELVLVVGHGACTAGVTDGDTVGDGAPEEAEGETRGETAKTRQLDDGDGELDDGDGALDEGASTGGDPANGEDADGVLDDDAPADGALDDDAFVEPFIFGVVPTMCEEGDEKDEDYEEYQEEEGDTDVEEGDIR